MSRLPALLLMIGWSFGVVFSQVVIQPTFFVAELYEEEVAVTTIADIACEDPFRDPQPPFVVSVLSITGPCPGCFQVYNASCNAGFCLMFLPVQQLSYAANPQYQVVVECQEVGNSSNVVSETVEVRLFPNTPPSITLPPSGFITIPNTKNIQQGDAVYTVSCSDPKNDALAFSLTAEPASTLFTIDTNGVIRAKEDLKKACFTSIQFTVTCSDGKFHTTQTIPVLLTDTNQVPVITGLNFNMDVPEDKAIGESLSTYVVTDDDATSCRISADPLDSLQFFHLDTITNTIEVKRTLDHEAYSTRNTNVTLTCSDDFCESLAYIYVRVMDVNEPVILVPDDFTLTVYEGNIVVDPQWTPIDPDIGEQYTYTVIDGTDTNSFTIHPTTGIISSTLEYDVDLNTMARTSVLVIEVKDRGGHTDTATVTLDILDINDHRPTINGGARVFTVQDCANNYGTTVGTPVTATDEDSTLDGNNLITFSGSSGPLTVDSSGNIILSSLVTAGSVYTTQVTATDNGVGPRGALTSSNYVTVTVVVIECITTTTATPTTPAPTSTPAPTTTTTPAPTTTAAPTAQMVTASGNSRDDLEENLAWIIVACLLGMVLLGLLGFMAVRYCCYSPPGLPRGPPCRGFFDRACKDCCVPRRRHRPPTPKRKPVTPLTVSDPVEYKFWKEDFYDRDLVTKADHQAMPRPVTP